MVQHLRSISPALTPRPLNVSDQNTEVISISTGGLVGEDWVIEWADAIISQKSFVGRGQPHCRITVRTEQFQTAMVEQLIRVLVICMVLAACGCSSGEPGTMVVPGPTNVAGAVADTWIKSVRPEQNDWSWGDGVLMFGLSEIAQASLQPGYWDYIKEWIDYHIKEGFYIAFSDNCPPAIAAVRLYRKTQEPRYLDVANRTMQYLDEVAARTSDGGLNHMGWVSRDQLWIDSLFMFGVFLAEMGSLTGDDRYFDLLCSQIKIFATHLRDPRTGFFLHMWDDGKQTTVPPDAIYWARGNGWVFVTLVELLARLPSTHPDRIEMESFLTTMAASLADTQDPSGLWHTVLNVPDTYLETSATALFCYGLSKGIRTGLLKPSFYSIIDRAKEGLISKLYVDCSGSLIVSGTSHGTSPGTLEDYERVTTGDQVPYGVGAVILAASETGLVVSTDSLTHEKGCGPVPPTLPHSAEAFVQAGIQRLETADLEGAREDFHQANLLDQGLGSALFGGALMDAIFLGLDLFDTVNRYSISELSWPDVKAHIRSQVLPELGGIQALLRQASEDPEFLFEVPELRINRSGLYTPIRDLRFDHASLSSIELLLGIVETLLRILS